MEKVFIQAGEQTFWKLPPPLLLPACWLSRLPFPGWGFCTAESRGYFFFRKERCVAVVVHV